MYLFLFLGACVLLLSYLGIWIKRWLSSNQVTKKSLEIARVTGLTEKEFKLLSVIGTSNKNIEKGQLLTSILLFDDVVGAYLKRFCKHTKKPGSVLTALESIRNKLVNFMGESSDQLKGLMEIPLLLRIEVVNLSRKGKKNIGQVVERQFESLRIIGLKGTELILWKPGDLIKVTCIKETGDQLEYLMTFKSTERRETGLCYLEFSKSASPALGANAEVRTLRYRVNLLRNRTRRDEAILEWVGPEGAFLKTRARFSAGEKANLELTSERTSKKCPVEATVIHTHLPPKDANTVSLGFQQISEDAMRVILEELSPGAEDSSKKGVMV